MKRYETVFITLVDLPEDELKGLLDRYAAIIKGLKGVVAKVEKWGKRRLAYEIRKQMRGYYFLIDFAGNSAIINELERNFKIDDKVLKFMTVVKADHVNLEELEKEIAAKTEKTEETPAPEPPKQQEPTAEKE